MGPVLGEVDLTVIELEVVTARAAFDGAFAAARDHRRAQLGPDVTPDVGHRRDVLAVLDDHGDERLTEQVLHPLRGHR